MNICAECKKEYNDDIKFCGYCGQKLISKDEYEQNLKKEKAEQDEKNKIDEIKTQFRKKKLFIKQYVDFINDNVVIPYAVASSLNWNSVSEAEKSLLILEDFCDIIYFHKTNTKQTMYKKLNSLYDEIKTKYDKIIDLNKKALALKGGNAINFRIKQRESQLYLSELKAYIYGGEFSLFTEKTTKYWYRKYTVLKSIKDRINDDVYNGEIYKFGLNYLYLLKEFNHLIFIEDKIIETLTKASTIGINYTFDKPDIQTIPLFQNFQDNYLKKGASYSSDF